MSQRRSWRFIDGAVLMVLVGLGVFASLPIWTDIINTGLRSEEQSHVLLALPIALWLVWCRRERLRYCRPGWTFVGPAVVAVGWALAFVGFTNGWDLFRHVGAILIVSGAVLTVVGVQFAIAVLPAFGALFFFLPIPGRIRHAIAGPLQEMTAKATAFGMDLFALPISRLGNVITINGHEVAVAEACNGMRMVAALALVTYAFVFSMPMRPGVRILLLVLSPVLALVVNIVRLVPTVLMYGYADPQVAEFFHDVSGWAMLFVALILLWSVLAVLRWVEVPIAPYAVGEN